MEIIIIQALAALRVVNLLINIFVCRFRIYSSTFDRDDD